MIDITEERNAFEAHMTKCHPKQSLECYHNEGEYVDQTVQFGFVIWCERSRAARIDGLVQTMTFLSTEYLKLIASNMDNPEDKDPEFLAFRLYLARTILARRGKLT
jgi:hypothetical protein